MSAAQPVTRGGWTPTGTSEKRRANTRKSPGSKAERTRSTLLDAARRVFAEHGYLDTTVDHIVTEADVSRGSFYTYFESKVEILRHLAARIDEQVETDVVAFDRSNTSNPIERLAMSTRNYLEVVRQNADLYLLVSQIQAYDDAVRESRLASRQAHVRRVAGTIARWQARGIADVTIDPHITAAALVSMQSDFAQWVLVGGDTFDIDAVADTITTIWVRTCGLTNPSH